MDEERLRGVLVPLMGEATGKAVSVMNNDHDVPVPDRDKVSGAELAVALGIALHQGLLDRVPTGAAYVDDCVRAGRRIMLDHGALRTICLPGGVATGGMAAGVAGFARLLEPLGYRQAGVYPLDGLRMTGYAYCHNAHPEHLTQYFISELHVDRFSQAFQDAAKRIFGTTRDPLTRADAALLGKMERDACLDWDEAGILLKALVGAFDRHHDIPALADYEIVKRESAEAAWIATEGNAFNHGTDRVDDLDVVVAAQRAAGRAMKDRIEISASGRVRQTATRADRVTRDFIDTHGQSVTREVPGSFYEFISRDIDPASGRLDLGFDSGNAQGIFKMTALDA
tara:strand:+ start:110482 stop:111501 length:1020 start_codon:yes stop_codon:yes gene_type:complete